MALDLRKIPSGDLVKKQDCLIWLIAPFFDKGNIGRLKKNLIKELSVFFLYHLPKRQYHLK